jgi:hypothetical protein
LFFILNAAKQCNITYDVDNTRRKRLTCVIHGTIIHLLQPSSLVVIAFQKLSCLLFLTFKVAKQCNVRYYVANARRERLMCVIRLKIC